MPYKQGLSDDFVAALNDLHASPEGTWWQRMLADPDLFVAIRHEYLNVYYRGCSLAKVRFDRDTGQVFAETHYKYLLKPRLKHGYVRADGGTYRVADQWSGGVGGPFTSSLCEVDDLKAAAAPYAGGEKKVVGEIIRKHLNIVDVEIALTKDADETEGASAKRLDMSVLRTSDGTAVLEFYEAKLFSNKELRAGDGADAKVVAQMATYTRLLRQYERDIRAGFKSACLNVIDLQGMPESRKALADTGLRKADNLIVDDRPYLIVVGLDEDQKRPGSVWSKHEEKLAGERGIGRDRLIVRGKADSISLANGKRARGAARVAT